MNSLLVVYSYHHNNTMKIAKAIQETLEATLVTPFDIDTISLDDFDLVGLGAGIDSAHHYDELLDCARKLPVQENKKSFIFSTSAVQGEHKVQKDHKALRDILVSKGFDILDEFSCKGYNTNSILKFIGGMNKKHPTEDDLDNARKFASQFL